MHIFLNILPPYIRRSPSPGLLVRPWHIGYRSRRQTELQKRVLRHTAPAVAEGEPRCVVDFFTGPVVAFNFKTELYFGC